MLNPCRSISFPWAVADTPMSPCDGASPRSRSASWSRKRGTPLVSSPWVGRGADRSATFDRVRATISSRFVLMKSFSMGCVVRGSLGRLRTLTIVLNARRQIEEHELQSLLLRRKVRRHAAIWEGLPGLVAQRNAGVVRGARGYVQVAVHDATALCSGVDVEGCVKRHVFHGGLAWRRRVRVLQRNPLLCADARGIQVVLRLMDGKLAVRIEPTHVREPVVERLALRERRIEHAVGGVRGRRREIRPRTGRRER